MTRYRIRTGLVALSLAAIVAATTSESRACCFSHRTTAYYAPVPVCNTCNYAPAPLCNTCNYAPAPVCNTCNYAPAPVCNTCNYVPQVAYRTVYTSVPVTSYRPITAVDPCTGCATTAFSPVTTYAMQPRVVAYTTYRPVVSSCCAPAAVSYAAPACPTGACGGIAAAPVAATYYTPGYTAPASSAPACCGGSTSTVAPAAPLSAPSSSQETTVPALPPSTPFTPSPDPSVSTPGASFKPNQSVSPAPIRDLNSNTGTRNSNTVVPPQTQSAPDRVTALPSVGGIRQISAKVAVPMNETVDNGWRAARR